jgi:hypothetical protein
MAALFFDAKIFVPIVAALFFSIINYAAGLMLSASTAITAGCSFLNRFCVFSHLILKSLYFILYFMMKTLPLPSFHKQQGWCPADRNNN